MNIHLIISILIQIAICNSEETAEAYVTAEKHGKGNYEFSYNSGFESSCNLNEKCVSHAFFDEKINKTGWASLVVESNSKYSDHIQAYWSGYLETNLTYDLTEAHWKNTFRLLNETFGNDPLIKDLKKVLRSNMRFMLRTAIKNKKDPFWYPVYLHLWQLRGIEDAFDKTPFVTHSSKLNDRYLKELRDKTFGIYLLQLFGDIWTYMRVLARGDRKSQLVKMLQKLPSPSGSLLFKVHNNDIFIGHVTAAPYTTMLRVVKRYDFPWKVTNKKNAEIVKGSTIVFSSYPSVTFSMDDFYMTNQRLVIAETNIPINNPNLYLDVKDKSKSSLMAYIRVMLANRVASNGTEWINAFERRSSGTFNNEWLIFDAKLFEKAYGKSDLPANTLLLLDQLPDRIRTADVTQELQTKTYFASFNIPYIKDIYDASRLAAKEETYNDGFYVRNTTTRYLMFEKWHNNVTSLTSMQKLMRYNDYLHDDLSMCKHNPDRTATKAISTRRDLNDINGNYSDPNYGFYLSGGTDVKVVDLILIKALEMMFTSGPTHDYVPAFNWSHIEKMKLTGIPSGHLLQPAVFNFGPHYTNLKRMTPQVPIGYDPDDLSGITK